MTETTKYQVIKKDRHFELRQYAGYIRAEVDIAGSSYRSAIYRGFSILAGYIFGDNIKAEKMAMTTPVQVSSSQKIEMTKPVMISGDGKYTVAFIMPSEYHMEDLPKPKNDAIRLTEVGPHRMAVIKFSGFYREPRADQAKMRLLNWLKKEKIQPIGDFIAAGYNPPWVPWFLAHNEVMIEVET
jgi:hypothetical protein